MLDPHRWSQVLVFQARPGRNQQNQQNSKKGNKLSTQDNKSNKSQILVDGLMCSSTMPAQAETNKIARKDNKSTTRGNKSNKSQIRVDCPRARHPSLDKATVEKTNKSNKT